MMLSSPKPISETDPAIAPANDGNQSVKAVVGNREVFQPLTPENQFTAVERDRRRHHSIVPA
jgi:hypothetical protein